MSYYYRPTYDSYELCKRALKYLVEGVVVAIAAIVIPRKGAVDIEAVAALAIIASLTFAILDIFAPNVGASVRTGAGFGIGANMVGFPV